MRRIIKYLPFLLGVLFAIPSASEAQYNVPKNSSVFVDPSGIMRWKSDSTEVSLFGVNYTAPFAYSYRALKKLNLSVKDAIDIDVSQMKRLGFNAFRVHVWDREISDENGNLIENEHLELLDYLLKRLSDNGIKIILTPIAWWGNGWPEPDEKTNGFSEKYSKQELITNPKAVEAENNYLKAFMGHRNKYSGYAYKDHPSIIAVEIINEPKHPSDGAVVTNYINELVKTIRGTDFNKPIFYNISENWSDVQANAVVKSEVEGVSFQWYPTALVHNHMLEGNFLLNVDSYTIPSENVPGFNKKTKMVYEFDAADIGASYMYPAMVRSFRKAGMQFAAMFSYDPSQIAWSNTEYPTHFMNLLYTPSKAISLMIASRAFMNLPLYKDYGSFPENSKFGDFRVSYEEDLSEMNSPEEFYYSNNTKSHPVEIEKLEHVAGCGSSPVIAYEGTGAYFLDKISAGLWMLEVNPDAVWINDPFGSVSLKREAARLFYNESSMKINLPYLSDDFKVYPLNDKKSEYITARGRELKLTTGKYLISNNELSGKTIKQYKSNTGKVPPVYTPGKEKDIAVVNHTQDAAFNNGKVSFTFTIASERKINEAYLNLRRPGWRGFEKIKLSREGKYNFRADVSSSAVSNGITEYCLTVLTKDGKLTFPAAENGSPDEWDFNADNLWHLEIHNADDCLVLFKAGRDFRDILFPHWTPWQKFFTDCKFSGNSEEPVFNCRVQLSGAQTRPFSFMNSVSKYIKLNSPALDGYKTLVLKGRYAGTSRVNLSLNLYFTGGQSLGAQVELNEKTREIEIPLSSLTERGRVIIPDSYPLFLNGKMTWALNENNADLSRLDFLEFTAFSSQQAESGKDSSYEFEIEKVYLKR
ncbi:MAG: cellulase family glycosylhydrolase [Syntrophomonadaceae bacterium]